MTYENTWDLESIFPGGTRSEALQTKLQETQEEMKDYEHLLDTWDFNVDDAPVDTLKMILQKQDKIKRAIKQSMTFVKMWHEAYMDDEYANVVMGQVMDLSSDLQKLSNTLTKKIVTIPEDAWKELLKDKNLKETTFTLNEIRDQGKRLLSDRSEEHTSELQSRFDLVCRLLL